MKDKLYGSAAGKVAALVLSGIFFAGLMACLTMYSMSRQFGIFSGTESFFDSPLFRELVVSHADEIVSSYINLEDGDYMARNIYSEESSNLSYVLYGPQEPGKLVLVEKAKNYDCENYAYKKAFVYHPYNLEEFELRNLGFNPSDVSSSDVIVRILVKVSDTLRPVDDLYVYSRRFAFVKQYAPYVPAAAAVCAAGILAALFFLLKAAGVRYLEFGVRPGLLERIPFEILFCVCIFPVLLFMNFFYDSFRVYSGTWYYAEVLILMFPAWYGLLTIMMTAAVRFKSGILMKSTLVYMICQNLPVIWERILRLVRRIPTIPMAVMVSCGWLMVSFILGRAHEYGLVFLFDILTVIVFLWFILQAKSLEEAGRQLASGNMEYRIENTGKIPVILRTHAEDLNSVAEGIEKAVSEKMKSERLRTELITNVSHDIKTPLTSIINYVDLLNKEHTEEEEKAYLEVLTRQTQRLKQLTEDVIDASKASSGVVEVQMGCVNVGELIDQALAEYEEKFNAAELETVRNVKDIPLLARSDGRLLWRVFSNLFSNCAKYSQPKTRVYLDAGMKDGQVCVSVKNISREMLNVSAEELMERFVRGDASRHTEGSGLGLNISQSLITLLGGKMELSVDGDLFKVTLYLPPYMNL